MDATFYEDTRFRGKPMLKRPMTLDLNMDTVKNGKIQRVNTLLTSPDLNMLKLGSPELERLIIAQHGLVTTATPTPNQCMYPKNNVEDREQYAAQFTDALTGMPHPPSTTNNNNGPMYHMPQDVNNVVPVTNNNASCLPCAPPSCSSNPNLMDNYSYHPPTCTSLMPSSTSGPITSNMSYPPVNNGYYSMSPNITIKEEPQTVPCAGVTPPLSPIDMEDQERIKLERKRLRNRIAASKCRRRKLERIARLEEKVSMLKGENSELTNQVSRLREQVCNLKQQVMDHLRCGCEMYNPQI